VLVLRACALDQLLHQLEGRMTMQYIGPASAGNTFAGSGARSFNVSNLQVSNACSVVPHVCCAMV
jgi:hypothetical protein